VPTAHRKRRALALRGLLLDIERGLFIGRKSAPTQHHATPILLGDERQIAVALPTGQGGGNNRHRFRGCGVRFIGSNRAEASKRVEIVLACGPYSAEESAPKADPACEIHTRQMRPLPIHPRVVGHSPRSGIARAATPV
jgi:hypothetical protein